MEENLWTGSQVKRKSQEHGKTIRSEHEFSVYAIFHWKNRFRKWGVNNQIWKVEISQQVMSNRCWKISQTLLDLFEKQKKQIYKHYSNAVALVVSGRITKENEIERIMDGLLDFGDDEDFLALYKKLCRHVYKFYPQMVGEHIALFRMQFEEKEEWFGAVSNPFSFRV